MSVGTRKDERVWSKFNQSGIIMGANKPIPIKAMPTIPNPPTRNMSPVTPVMITAEARTIAI